MIDDRGDAKDGWVAAVVLEMPEEEGEDEPDADPHDPRHNHERQQTEVGKGLREKNSLEY